MSPRARGWLFALGALVVILIFSARAIARFYTDFLWFQSLDSTQVWRTILFTKFGLGLAFSLIFFVLLNANLLITERLAPVWGPLTAEDELLARYRELVGSRQRTVRVLISVLFALVAGLGASGQWNNWLLFRHGGSFGQVDPLLERDIGFYIFDLPFLSYAVSWMFAATVIILMVTVVSHYLNGGIRLQASGQRVTPQVKAHLSVLLAVLALLKAADYLLQRSQLLLSERGAVRGATYTDVNAQLPAIHLLVLISLLSAVVFIVNIRQRGWALPVVGVSLWVLVAMVAGQIYPWFIQTFQVSRKESAREAPYIERNIAATRTAMGLDSVEERDFDYTGRPPDEVITENASTIDNIRLLDPAVVDRTFSNLESQLTYYRFVDLDVDRYPIAEDGSNVAVVLSARELNPTSLPQDTWEARHLIYTHGYAVALAPANAVTSRGRPDFLVSGVSPLSVDPSVAGVLSLTRPELYFGEGIDGPGNDGYAIVGTTRREDSAGLESSYEGKGGVEIRGFLRRAAFYLRFGDLETLTSDYLTRQSRILYVRDVRERVRTLAPFLHFDRDPYPVIVEGRVKYLIDGYTTAATYPYAQRADTSQLEPGADLARIEFNYVRNSVKAVVDAYDGDVQLYLTDELYGGRDPIVRAYARAFPKLFKPLSSLPEVIRKHLRYPEDLFRLQTTMWGRYHISTPQDFYNASDRWDVAQDPGRDPGGTNPGATGSGLSSGSLPRIAPYYLMMRVPGEEDDEFQIFRPFVPHSDDDSKRQLTAFMVGKSDPGSYGKLQVFTMTRRNNGKRERNRDVNGPITVNNQMLSTTTGNTSQNITLLNTGGSKVELGNLLIVPIDLGLLYVRPVYVRAASADSAVELRKVIVAVGDRVQVGDTLAEALRRLFTTAKIETREGAVDSLDEVDGSSEGPRGEEPAAAELLDRALQLFDEADDALKNGGAAALPDYQSKVAQAQDLIERVQRLLDPTGEATPILPGAESPTTTQTPATTTTGSA